MIVEVKIGWPAPALNPNARVHWAEWHKAAKAAKNAAHMAVVEVIGAGHRTSGRCRLIGWTIHPRGKSAPDQDNLIASLKAAQDGIARALHVDDKGFRPWVKWGDVRKGGEIVAHIEVPE